MPRFFTLLLLLAACNLPAQQPNTPADLILHNGVIWTVNTAQPLAQAVAITGNRISRVGSNSEAMALRGAATRLIDLHGRLLLPGFNHAHTHLENAAQWFFEVRLIDVTDPQELLKRLRITAARVPNGMWITGTDWGAMASWKAGGGLPPKADLAAIDASTPHHPVLFRRYDRAFFANSEALRLAGIREITRDPKGGRYGHDPVTGRFDGMLYGSAGEQVELMLPPATVAKKRIGARGVIAELNSFGITSIQDIARLVGVSQQQTRPIFTERSYSDVGIFRDLKESGELRVRVLAFLPLQTWRSLEASSIGPNTGYALLRYGALKDFTDGSFMFEPYSNNPANFGNWTFRFPGEATVAKNIIDADRAGFDIALHVTGDRAFHSVLDWYDAAAKANGPRDRRDSLIHARFARQEDLGRAGKMHLIADVTPDQLLNDIPDIEAVAGPERAKTAFAWRTMIDSGAKIDIVLDLPGLFNKQQIATINPLEHMFMAITRRTSTAEGPAWRAEQRLNLQEGIQAYTFNPAFASHEENVKGTITQGKLADLVVLSNNILGSAPEALLNAIADYTILDCKILLERVSKP